MTMHTLVGHELVRKSLVGAHVRDSLPTALLLHGHQGIGKQRLALWTAQLVVCKDVTPDGPCGGCGPCRMALNLEHPDIHWFFPVERPKKTSRERLAGALEDARLAGLAERRTEAVQGSYSPDLRALYLGVVQNIRKRAHLKPTMAPGQVFIVGDADLLVPQESSPEAANALLKLLEEPPGDSRFILTSSEPGRLLPTIRSRTVPLQVGGLPQATVADFLVQHEGVEEETAEWAASLARGSIGRALDFVPDGKDRGPLEELRRRAYALVDQAVGSDAGGYALALSFPTSKARTLVTLFGFVDEWLRDLAAVTAGAADLLFNADARAALEALAERRDLSGWELTHSLSAVAQAREYARGNVNPQLVVSGLMRDLRVQLSRHAAPAVRT